MTYYWCKNKFYEYSKFGNEIVLILLALISLLTIINNFILLINYTPVGYVIDIYSQLPSKFWYGSSLIFFWGCILFFQESKKIKNIGIIILFINYILILFVPYELGYYSSQNGDELSHIGYIKNIISTGYIDIDNIYPATHIYLAEIALINKVNPNLLALTISSFFSIVFVFGMFILSRRLLESYDKTISCLTIPISLVYYFSFYHFAIIPNFLFFAIIPLILFILYKYMNHKTPSLSVILIIFFTVMTFGHPLIYIFILYILILFFLKNKIIRGEKKEEPKINTLLIFLLCFFLVWFIYNLYYLKVFGQMYSAFTKYTRESVAASGADKLLTLNLQGIELVKFTFLFYGRYIIPLFFIFFLIVYTIKKRKNISKNKLKSLYILIAMLFLFGLFELFLLINTFMIHNAQRIFDLNFIVFSMIPLFALSLHHLILKRKHEWKVVIISSVVLMIVFTLSMYGALYSPNIERPNIATTYNEVAGMEWLFQNKDEKPIYDLLGETGKRYGDLILSKSEEEQRLGKDILYNAKIEDHFGYERNVHFNGKEGYIVVTTEGELLYQTLYKKIGRYNASDFEKFKNDPSVNKIYDNLNIEFYTSFY